MSVLSKSVCLIQELHTAHDASEQVKKLTSEVHNLTHEVDHLKRVCTEKERETERARMELREAKRPQEVGRYFHLFRPLISVWVVCRSFCDHPSL